MDEFVNSLIHCLGQINPLYAVLALGVYTVFGNRLKGLFSGLLARLPKLPAPKPDAPKGDPKTDLNAWLENHPLADRLWVKVKELFGQVADGKVSEDDAYVKILDGLKSVDLDE